MITYGYTILYVEDVEKTIAFYDKAFGLTQKFITPEKDYGELATGQTTLAFASYKLAEYNGISISRNATTSFEIALVTDVITSTWERALAAGATIEAEPKKKPWGQEVGYLRDINGYLIEVCTPVVTG